MRQLRGKGRVEAACKKVLSDQGITHLRRKRTSCSFLPEQFFISRWQSIAAFGFTWLPLVNKFTKPRNFTSSFHDSSLI